MQPVQIVLESRCFDVDCSMCFVGLDLGPINLNRKTKSLGPNSSISAGLNV